MNFLKNFKLIVLGVGVIVAFSSIGLEAFWPRRHARRVGRRVARRNLYGYGYYGPGYERGYNGNGYEPDYDKYSSRDYPTYGSCNSGYCGY